MTPSRDSLFGRASWRLLRPAAVVLTGWLMFGAFPPMDAAECAWVAVVPLMFLASHVHGRAAFGWGWAAGMAWWLPGISWILNLSRTGGVPLPLIGLGWVALSAYCALYAGLFSFACSAVLSRDGVPRPLRAPSALGTMFLLPTVWVGLEYARATLFTGFAWNPLGGSQYRTLPIAQVAELGGVYAVSWLVVYMNCALYFTFRRVAARCRGERVAGLHPELMAGLLAVAVALGWGQARRQKLWRESEQGGSVRVVAVQPAIAQTDKWDPETDELVLGRLRDLTSLSGALRPDLVLWPETALPSVFNVDTNAQKFAASLSAAAGAPLLVGALEYKMSAAKDFYYNSSFLVGPDGESGGVYRKQHLVLFGEYLPGEDRHPWIGRFSPLGYSCLPGGESVVFRAAGNPFSPLICFEDTVPALSRAARNAGAGFIVVQTNDAWFDGTPGLQQHMAHSVFRAIENRCPVVRCANTGITCMVDATGGVESLGSGRDAALGVAGFHPFEVRPASGQPSFYTVRGDSAFAGPCAILTVLLFLLVAVFAARKNRASAAGAGAGS